MTAMPNAMTDQEVADRIVELTERLVEAKRTRMLEACYAEEGSEGFPYEWQVKFHNAGKVYTQRALLAANQVGKTRTGAAEIAMHMTGWYPDWWNGHRFDKPVRILAAGPTNQVVRDVQQKSLFGPMEEAEKSPSGTGWIPAHLIKRVGYRQCGIPDVIDTVQVQHSTGGISELTLKSYEMGAVKFQGVQAEVVWLDEEPDDHRIFTECLARLVATDGILIFTRTPLFGLTPLIRHFTEGGPRVWHTTATWADAPHLSVEKRNELADSFPDHERDTRTRGLPMMGSGGVYSVPDAQISYEHFPIPDHFRRICGIDFGIDHPAAAVWIAHDADADVIYVYDCYKQAGQTAAYHAQAILARGKEIPVAWPHDGMVRDKGGGEPLAAQYADKGVNMLPISARYDDDKGGSQGREPVTLTILERMHTGRILVASHLAEWFTEKRMLHREGEPPRIVPKLDDLESATRYAVMMLRYAMNDEEMTPHRRQRRVTGYNPLAAFTANGA